MTQQQQEELNMLSDINQWPNAGGGFRYCCVKNYDLEPRQPGNLPSMNSFGQLQAQDNVIFTTTPNVPGSVTILREYADPITFQSMQALVEAGWIAD